jgi:hypothetical protein
LPAFPPGRPALKLNIFAARRIADALNRTGNTYLLNMKKTLNTLLIGLLLTASACSKKDKVAPVTKHELTFTTNANGYKTVISLQKKGDGAENAQVLESVNNTGTSYSYRTTISTGDHLLVTISLNGAKDVYHYQIDDNNTKADAGDVNVAAGTSLILHYPKD